MIIFNMYLTQSEVFILYPLSVRRIHYFSLQEIAEPRYVRQRVIPIIDSDA